jgi:hypothetical protein
MPRGDGTGPNGAGRMTGRGAGYCTGNNTPGYTNPNTAVGYGRGYANTDNVTFRRDPASLGRRQMGLSRRGYGFR